MEPGTEAYVATGMSGAGALLNASLARSFLQTHKRANRQLNRCYAEPKITGLAVAVERILQQLPAGEVANTGRMALVEGLIREMTAVDAPAEEDRPAKPATDKKAGTENGSTQNILSKS